MNYNLHAVTLHANYDDVVDRWVGGCLVLLMPLANTRAQVHTYHHHHHEDEPRTLLMTPASQHHPRGFNIIRMQIR